MPLDDIVNVVITRQTQTVSERGFGIPMILGTSNKFTDLIRFYSNMDEVRVDFSPSDPEYIASQDIFSQIIAPEQIAIGRRQVDNVTIGIETAMANINYNVIVNDQIVTYLSTSSFNYSVVNLNNDLFPLNRIAVSVNGTGIGTTTSVIDFDSDFVASNSILATINGVGIAPVVFNTDQSTTLSDLATALQATVAISTATVTGSRQITAVFATVGTNTINSIVTTLGASQPIATIAQGGFLFDTDTQTTMNNIATQIMVQFPTFTAIVSPSPYRGITVQAPTGQSATFNSFIITGGATQATATITNPLQPPTKLQIVAGIVAEINLVAGLDPLFAVSAVDNFNETFTVVNNFTGVAYTLRVSTNILNTNASRIRITQVEENTAYTVRINGIEFTYVSPVGVQSADQIAQALTDLINIDPTIPVQAVNNNDGTFSVSSINNINTFSVSVSPEIMDYQNGLIIQPLIASNPVADDLDAINNANDTWYALMTTSRDIPTVKAIALWTESRIKLFGTASDDLTIIDVQAGIDTTSIAAFLNQAGYVRTFVMYHQDALTDYPEGAWFGRVLPLVPGSETWAFKTLSTISNSNLTTTQVNNALAKKCNIYTFVGGVNITQNGTVAQGEYIDTIRGIDWLRSRIQEFVYALLVRNDKIPYTNAGITTIQAEVKRALALGVANNFLTDNPAPVVTVPLAQNVPTNDKANRILRDVKFQATLAGAIQIVRINGIISI